MTFIIYDFLVLDRNKGSITRFWILARDPIVPTNDGSFKVCSGKFFKFFISNFLF